MKTPMKSHNDASDLERGRLTIGVPGVVSAELPVRDSSLKWLRKVFRRPEVAARVSVPWGRGHIYAHAADDGRLTLNLVLVSMLPLPLMVERINFDALWIAGIAAPIGAPVCTPPHEPLAPFSISDIVFDIALTSALIRQVRQHVQMSPNRYSTPLIELRCAGSLDIEVRSRRSRVPFSVVIRGPEIHLADAALAEA